jgi:hypothetical protein
MPRLLRPLALTLLVLSLALPAAADELHGVTMPESRRLDGELLALNGMGLRKVLFIKVYVAGLYLRTPSTDAEAVLAVDQPRIMAMHFLRTVTVEDIREAWLQGLQDNTPAASADLEARFRTLNAAMEQMHEDETMEFAYVPGQGTRVYVKGEEKTVVPGKDFADALLACWIGPVPGPGRKFRQAVLSDW